MTSRNSSSNPTIAWMKQLVKRNIAIPVIALACYLLVTELILLTSVDTTYFSDWTIKNLMMGRDLFTFVGSVGFGVVLSAAFLHDLHDRASATCVHALPLTRGQMMLAATLTGIMMIAVVQVIVTVAMFGTCNVMLRVHAHHVSFHQMTQLLTLPHCLVWLRNSFLMALFSFALAQTCGVIAGNKIVHLLLVAYMMVLPVCLWLLEVYYLSVTFFGSPHDTNFHLLRHVPLYSLYFTKFAAKDLMIQVVCTVVLLALSFVIYRYVKLERVPSATLFPLFSDFLCFSLTFIGMTFVLMLTDTLMTQGHFANRLALCVTSLISSAIIFLICRMIATSSLWVFNITTLKKYLIYIIMTAVIFSATFFNVFGIGKHVPKAEDVTSVTLSTNLMNANVTLSDPAVIQEITTLHRQVIDQGEPNQEGSIVVLSLDYRLKNGKTLNRYYMIDTDETEIVKQYEKVLHSDAFYDAYFPAYEKMKAVTLSHYDYNDDGAQEMSNDIKKEDLPALMTALRQDLKNLEVESLISSNNNWTLAITTGRDEHRFDLPVDYVHTWAFLKEKGYDKNI